MTDYSRERFYSDIREIALAIGLKKPLLGFIGGMGHCCYIGEGKPSENDRVNVRILAGCPKKGRTRFSVQVNLGSEYVHGDGYDTLSEMVSAAPRVVRQSLQSLQSIPAPDKWRTFTERCLSESWAAVDRVGLKVIREEENDRDGHVLVVRVPKVGCGRVYITSRVDRSPGVTPALRITHAVCIGTGRSSSREGDHTELWGVAHNQTDLVKLLRPLVRSKKVSR